MQPAFRPQSLCWPQAYQGMTAKGRYDMGREKIRCFQCCECSDCFTYEETVPKKVPGALLEFGKRYCGGGKRTRGFKPRDPKVYPPSWCPKLKNPAEYRVYAYKDANAWYLHHLLRTQGLLNTPSGHEFAVRADGHTALSARDFWREVKYKSASEILGVPIYYDEVIEIDDGLRPHFFHVEDGKVKVLSYFQSDKARKNQYVERTTPKEDE